MNNIYRATRTTSIAYDIWSIFAFIIGFGVMFALATVVVAIGLVLVVGAVLMGLVMPSRTVGGQLRSVVLNVRQAVVEVDALRPN